jgi:hypothetical protein
LETISGDVRVGSTKMFMVPNTYPHTTPPWIAPPNLLAWISSTIPPIAIDKNLWNAKNSGMDSVQLKILDVPSTNTHAQNICMSTISKE